ncbi:MAG: zinc transporter ZupT [Lentisphaerae bacterium GWF2_44_16]|nr:MAG: zinc transporter ZupT [Lentisphaerae bacterium GWF2_44_16]
MTIAPENVMIAFGLTLFAGLSTGIGSAIAFFAKRTNTKLLAVSLGFSAGVMIYVSFVELFLNAQKILGVELGAKKGQFVTVAAFFTGIFLVALIDKLVPSFENPHEAHKVEEMREKRPDRKLLRMGILSAVVIGMHNFPEGLATFAAALKEVNLGISIAIAIAIHNIPEGIAVSVPVYYATGSRKKAFLLSFLSGLAEPLGALVGYLVIFSFMNDTILGVLFAAVAGIMVFISLDELLPTAEKYGEHHLAIYGLLGGMLLMASSLLLF